MLNVDRKCKNKQTLVHKKWNAQKVERKEENEKNSVWDWKWRRRLFEWEQQQVQGLES